MDFRPIVAPSIRELFIQQVEGAILSGQLKPGDRLPTERELADTMHISKTVVHEGLRELHRLGFLDIASRRGVTVADYAQTGSLETLMAIMDYHGGLPDEKTARSILRLRYYLEAPALRDLAASHTAADLDTLRALQRQAEEAPDTAALAQALFRYHRGGDVFKRQHHHPPAVQRLHAGEPGVLVRLYPVRGPGGEPAYPGPVHGPHRRRRGGPGRPAAGRRPAAVCDHAVNSHFVQNIRLFLWKSHRFRSENSAICQLCSPPGVV